MNAKAKNRSEPVSIEFEGKTYLGNYIVADNMVTIRSVNEGELCGSFSGDAAAAAKRLLRELLTRKNQGWPQK